MMQYLVYYYSIKVNRKNSFFYNHYNNENKIKFLFYCLYFKAESIKHSEISLLNELFFHHFIKDFKGAFLSFIHALAHVNAFESSFKLIFFLKF